MEVLRGLAELRPEAPGRPVMTLGFFDGVHLGHQRVLDLVLARAKAFKAPALVLTFENHPAEVLRGKGPPTLTSLPHRLRLFAERGVDRCLVLRFDEALARMEAEDFAREIIVGRIGARAVVLGFDSTFGRAARGNAELLASMADELGIRVESSPVVQVDGRPVSSTAVRGAVAAGDLDQAASMLGRPVEVLGTVVPGEARGRDLGFPTANLDLHHEVRPPRGVYAGDVPWKGKDHVALINIGRRPTFHPEAGEDLVEVHLLDFHDPLYGEELRVRFRARLRDERRFASAAELTAAIQADREAALAAIHRNLVHSAAQPRAGSSAGRAQD